MRITTLPADAAFDCTEQWLREYDPLLLTLQMGDRVAVNDEPHVPDGEYVVRYVWPEKHQVQLRDTRDVRTYVALLRNTTRKFRSKP